MSRPTLQKIGKDVSFSMIYIDLDNFADIDNTFGTKETNKILERITKRMVGIVPKNVKVSRYEVRHILNIHST